MDESRLIDLVAGLLSPQETEATLAHVRHCADCERRMRMLSGERESLAAGPVPVMRDGRIQLSRRYARPARIRWVAVAATVAIVAAVGALLLTRRDRGLEYWIPVENEATILRSATDSTPASSTQDVLQPYLERDAKTAVKQLEHLEISPDDVTASSLRSLFLASALVNAGRAEDALVALDQIPIGWLPTPWRDEAEWVQYLALARAGRASEARDLLQRLSEDSGAIGERARRELRSPGDR